ncbi:MAG: polyketide cyclase [Bacteroidetes bacterium GWD2_45_23]|nr:MAG: polyketide cyclase [Bacteroidetes bacterium GWC2_46_850]OFX72624.1 MAG: polyketide cyclase [Bacteroidetes bacterium GWC1_47_7]OFX87488.1 MAG: polyketide cyclase [Bacteroidetes bacterium GWD2_45_23]HAR38411.1 polyketide cyclase [Porphyromonadaceae bacterium]HBB01575.1 polyketide cyclase [Porphyromonadaceae bacterium]
MTEFVSEVKIIPYNDADVFRVLSDLNKLELVKDQIPEDKLKDFSFDADTVSFRVDPIGKISFVVEEREPNKLVKFKSDNFIFNVFVWIQLVSQAENDTRLRLTLRADLNPFIKAMAEKPMREAVDKIANALAHLPYDRV